MIEPTKDDIGRKVIFRNIKPSDPEEGVITSFNEHFVFVRYGSDVNSKVTLRQSLEWI